MAQLEAGFCLAFPRVRAGRVTGLAQADGTISVSVSYYKRRRRVLRDGIRRVTRRLRLNSSLNTRRLCRLQDGYALPSPGSAVAALQRQRCAVRRATAMTTPEVSQVWIRDGFQAVG